MIEKDVTLGELLDHPKVREQLLDDEYENLSRKCEKEEVKDPIYIRLLTGIGAWVAGIFLIAFLAVADALTNSVSAIIFGAIFMAGAIGLARVTRNIFGSQFSMALAFAGNMMLLYGISDSVDDYGISVLTLIQFLITIVVYPLYNNGVYRYVAPVATVAMTVQWIVSESYFTAIHSLIALEMLLVALLYVRKQSKSFLRPLRYAVVTMLPVTILWLEITQIEEWRSNFIGSLLPSSLLLAGGLSGLFIYLSGGLSRCRQSWMVLAIVSTLLLGIFASPGILIAIALLVVGYHKGDNIVMGMAYLFLPCFIFVFYYALNVDLAYKSWVVAGSGVLLLIARQIVKQLQRHEEAV